MIKVSFIEEKIRHPGNHNNNKNQINHSSDYSLRKASTGLATAAFIA